MIQTPTKTKGWVPYALLLPAFLTVLLFIVYPVCSMVVMSFQDTKTKAFTLANYHYFFFDQTQRDNLWFTLVVVFWTVLLSLIFGLLLALYLRFRQSWISRLINESNILSRFVPGLVAVYSMILIIRDAGLLHRVVALFGINWQPGLMYNAKGIVLMNLWFNIPFVCLILVAALGGVRQSSIDAARDIGASKLQLFWTVILPLIRRECFVAATFVIMGNVGSFTTPFLMGGNHPKMLGIVLYDQFSSYTNYQRTAALSVIMFLLCSVSAVVYILQNMKKARWES